MPIHIYIYMYILIYIYRYLFVCFLVFLFFGGVFRQIVEEDSESASNGLASAVADVASSLNPFSD